ncbi:MAG: response regulator [Lewinellaceae bacterium]|nr:response regulator [Lewinellaceae bacterium]
MKGDFRTNHIPIILLTAKTDVDSRIRGLESGADAYLPKPFHRQELQVELRNSSPCGKP